MKESLFKRTFTSPLWKHILSVLGIIAVLDWVVFPALTASNTMFNIVGLLALLGTLLYAFYYVKDILTVEKPKAKNQKSK